MLISLAKVPHIASGSWEKPVSRIRISWEGRDQYRGGSHHYLFRAATAVLTQHRASQSLPGLQVL